MTCLSFNNMTYSITMFGCYTDTKSTLPSQKIKKSLKQCFKKSGTIYPNSQSRVLFLRSEKDCSCVLQLMVVTPNILFNSFLHIIIKQSFSGLTIYYQILLAACI